MAFAWGDAAGAVVDERRKQRTEAVDLEQALADRAYKQALIQQAQQQMELQRQRMAQEDQRFNTQQQRLTQQDEIAAAERRQATNQRGVQDMVGQLIRTEGVTPQNRGQIIGTLMEAGRMPTQADLALHGGEEPFTLGPGQKRFGPDGREIAAGLPPQEASAAAGFTLSPGQIRYDASGKRIASGAPQQSAAKAGTSSGNGEISKYAAETARRTIQAVDDVMPDINNWTAGWIGSALSNVPGTKAANVSAELSSVASNIAFNALQAMRDASKTGGALGQVSERELDLLSAVEGSIRQNQSPANLKMQLQKVRDSMARVQAAAGGAAPATQQQTGGGVEEWVRDPKTGKLMRKR